MTDEELDSAVARLEREIGRMLLGLNQSECAKARSRLVKRLKREILKASLVVIPGGLQEEEPVIMQERGCIAVRKS